MLAYGYNPNLLEKHWQWFWGLYQVVPHLLQAITYPSYRATDQPWCSLMILVEIWHTLHGLWWQNISAHCQILLQISLPFDMTTTIANTVINHLKRCLSFKENPQEYGQPFKSKEVYTENCGFKHTTSIPHYLHIQWLHRVKCPGHQSALNKAKASKIPIQQAIMKLCQTPISPNFPSPAKILQHCLVGLHIPGQKTQLP